MRTKREWKGKERGWRCELEPRGRLFVLNMEDIDEFLVMASDKEYSRLPLRESVFRSIFFVCAFQMDRNVHFF